MIWLARSIIREAFEGFVLTSSGGGEPEDGVETEGEPGSGGEFIVGKFALNGKCHRFTFSHDARAGVALLLLDHASRGSSID